MSHPGGSLVPIAGARRQVLLVALCSLFVGFFVTAELLGAKLWSFGLPGIGGPRDLGLGEEAAFVATTGILAFPLTFILTDIINEYFGRPMVKLFTFAAIAVNLLLQPVVQVAIRVPAVSFTPGVTPEEIDRAYRLALGQTWAIVVASLTAFAIAQFLDVWIFTWLRRRTGGKMLWLRAQGSTAASQVVDTLVVIFVAFVVIPGVAGGEPWSGGQALRVAATNYVYKFAIAVGITPLLYGVHALVDAYLGKQEAEALILAAHPLDPP
jgi:queuosine precursor transporter